MMGSVSQQETCTDRQCHCVQNTPSVTEKDGVAGLLKKELKRQ